MRMNLVRFFYHLLIVAVGMTIACAKSEPMARLSRSEEASSDIQLKRYADIVKNYYYTFGKARHGKRNDVPIMELSTTWEILKMIQDAQRQNKQRKQENIRQNKEQILLRDFPSSSSDTDEYMYDAVRFESLPDIIGKYYNDVQ